MSGACMLSLHVGRLGSSAERAHEELVATQLSNGTGRAGTKLNRRLCVAWKRGLRNLVNGKTISPRTAQRSGNGGVCDREIYDQKKCW